jgi:hypothetical protein
MFSIELAADSSRGRREMLGSVRNIVWIKYRIFQSDSILNVRGTYFGLEHTFRNLAMFIRQRQI